MGVKQNSAIAFPTEDSVIKLIPNGIFITSSE